MGSLQIHQTAVIDEGARIGQGTKVWHFCHISSGATIGHSCVLGQNVFVGNRVTIGNNVRIQNNVSVYDDVILEDDVFCGPSMVFTNVMNPRAHVSRKSEYKTTIVRRGATLGANSTILCGITLGEYSFVGAGAVVLRSIPAYALAVGNPAKVIGWMSEEGHRLINDTAMQWKCPVTGRHYHERDSQLYPLSGLSI